MPITIFIIALTCIISYLAWQKTHMMQQFIFYPYKMNNNPKEYYRFISSGLIHADPQHLIFNMLTLFFFGRQMEEFFGPLLFIVFYFTALIASSLVSFFKNKHNSYFQAYGASGAVSSVLFAFILFAPWAEIYVYFIKVPAIIYAVIYIGYSLYMNKQKSDNIGHEVHLCGAFYGILFTAIAFPSAVSLFIYQISTFRM
jgi:membrane associated rhomboid family serine protease